MTGRTGEMLFNVNSGNRSTFVIAFRPHCDHLQQVLQLSKDRQNNY